MQKQILATACFFGITAVILGAFGAHTLKETLSPEMLSSFETGVRYQMYHALLLLALGVYPGIPEKTKRAVYWLATFGVVSFSGSIYLLSTSKITGVDFRPIGWITPVGGLLLIVAWFLLFIGAIRKKS